MTVFSQNLVCTNSNVIYRVVPVYKQSDSGDMTKIECCVAFMVEEVTADPYVQQQGGGRRTQRKLVNVALCLLWPAWDFQRLSQFMNTWGNDSIALSTN